MFRIPMLDHWLVVATDIQAVEDIRQAPDDVLSFEHALFLVRRPGLFPRSTPFLYFSLSFCKRTILWDHSCGAILTIQTLSALR